MTTWILERDVFAENCFGDMVDHFKAHEIPYHVIRVIPFVHEIDGKVPQIVGPAVAYGSIGIQKVAARHGWRPGVFTGDFSTSAYKKLGKLFVNHDAVILPFNDVAGYLERENWVGDEIFIKPNDDNKAFAGEVMPISEFVAWRQGLISIGYLDNLDFEVAVASPKKLGCEWRVVVVDGRVVTSSLVRQYGVVKPERHSLQEVDEIVYDAARLYRPAPVYVADVAETEDGFKILEYNTFNSAGLYACDVGAIIDSINDFVGSVE